MPLSWIGGRIRYVIEDLEGNKVAKKLDVLPTPTNPKNQLGTQPAVHGPQRDAELHHSGATSV